MNIWRTYWGKFVPYFHLVRIYCYIIKVDIQLEKNIKQIMISVLTTVGRSFLLFHIANIWVFLHDFHVCEESTIDALTLTWRLSTWVLVFLTNGKEMCYLSGQICLFCCSHCDWYRIFGSRQHVAQLDLLDQAD